MRINTLKTIEEIRKTWDKLSINELQEEVDTRKKLRVNMVGAFYPAIVYGEECEIAAYIRIKRI